jgi:photosystem II stability/assembly factor-like uncharacterized protein
MIIKLTQRIVVIGITFVLLLISAGSVGAQEGSFTETFDNPSLPGWENSPGATVTGGILNVGPGDFATYGGQWEHMTLSARMRRSGDGEIVILYRTSHTGVYILVLGPNFILSQRETSGVVTELAGNSPVEIPVNEWFQLDIIVAGGEHRILINEKFVLASFDEDPLPPGGIGFETLREAKLDLDELAITLDGSEDEVPVVEPPPPPPETSGGDEQPSLDLGDPLPVSNLKWVYTGGPPGGLGYDIRYNFENPDIWYVTDSFAGLFRSTDGGATWVSSSTGITSKVGTTGDLIPVFSLTVDPHNPNIVWAGTQNTGHIYKSTDYGQTWVQKDNGVTITYAALHFRGFTIDPRSSDIVYAMAETTSEEEKTGGQVFKSTNGGDSWELIWDGGMPSALARYMFIHPQNPDVLYVSTGIFDRGARGPEPYSNLTSGLGVLKSTDGGQTWSELNMANGLETLHIGSIYMHPEEPDTLLAAAGHVWTFEELETVESQGIRPAGVYRTADGGETWEKVLAAGDFRPAETFCSVEFCTADPNIAYAASVDAIYRSEDAGLTWFSVSREFGWGPPGVLAGFPIDIQCDPSDHNRLFINNYGGGNFLSEDGGRTWRNASQGYTGAQIISVAVDPTSPGRVFATGSQSGIWGTHDGGTTWVGLRPENVGVYQNGPGAIAVDPGNPNHLISGGRPGFVIFDSFDSGDNWRQLWTMHEKGIESDLSDGAIPTAIVFAPSDPRIVYLGGLVRAPVEPYTQGIGVFISTDNGKTWRQTKDNRMQGLSPYDLAVDPNNDKTVYAGTGDGVYKSTDGGDTWTLLNFPNEGSRVFAVAVNPHNSDHVIAGLEKIGPYVSQDGGQTWKAGIAGWEPNGVLTGIVFDPNNSKVVFLSDFFSGVFRSGDGGFTWMKINNGLTVRSVWDLVISGDGAHLYTATDGAGVLRLDLYGNPPQASLALTSTDAPYIGEGQGPGESSSEEDMGSDEEPAEGEEEPTIPCIGNLLPLLFVGMPWLRKRMR